MISFNDLSRKTKDQIRDNQELTKAFKFYFLEKFNQEPSFCCTFSDYTKLFNNTKNRIMAKSKKYKIGYASNFVLAYRKDGRTYRTMVKNADDKFLDEFMKHHAEAHFPNAKKHITLIEKPETKKHITLIEKPETKKVEDAPTENK